MTTTKTHRDRSQEIADEALQAGLPLRGLLRDDLAWRPGIVVKRSITNKNVVKFATEHGYTLCPSGRDAIIEDARP